MWNGGEQKIRGRRAYKGREKGKKERRRKEECHNEDKKEGDEGEGEIQGE